MLRTSAFVFAAALLLPVAGSAQHLSLVPAISQGSEDGEVVGRGRGRRDVDLVDYGRFRMPDRRDYKNLISIGWLLPVGVTVRYDRLILDNFSVLAQAGYGSWKLGGAAWNSWRLAGGFNWHPIGNGMHGFFVGPRVQFTDWSIKYEDSSGVAKGGVSSLVFSALAGYRWIWDPGFSLGLGLGAAYRVSVAESDVEYDDGSEASSVNLSRAKGFGFDLEFTLGWAF